jgi:hypothetical protein
VAREPDACFPQLPQRGGEILGHKIRPHAIPHNEDEILGPTGRVETNGGLRQEANSQQDDFYAAHYHPQVFSIFIAPGNCGRVTIPLRYDVR